ncbi:50S ribosomal protein L29 [Candidatus Giovannonibacteria bacterium RIFCSPLOWO2_01_FULL_43_160]|uniref:Large ribosomal subunit protein uL29 n=2 Tax=Candidatus Giovannoniibacteriota TaxID=1752738 RepID=A0A0G1LV12_9BACT|nr:MAG: 50S ribosomal protein L29P [Candidatus Giovannonibacteria bacterium GW2011_GWB1_43_13]KKS99853.1 MAG: 50S ribosomal protein L29P [Candidatus Giovannonibacteria bacterium GW2011_GWA1_43_15]KKT21037.1 MAG: 50S ribosomal protein L29P [Candidatus Giovannonibacteria bacterium GW2011_GWC2_43_8]KKT63554.1 MAG: 50S ribosomal protein L29P [Candidatus Giovannonibacteria bacterium GW2011_GWA2_44_26]OGF58572.1 MAG: 50S ribosomal protein L29 [Candidatus Giovannonibacteria bacterium RIFCSPHIGHO2_01_F
MAKLKIKDLKNKGGTELAELLSEEREKLLTLKMRARESKVKNVKEAKEIRKNIARMLTILKINK